MAKDELAIGTPSGTEFVLDGSDRLPNMGGGPQIVLSAPGANVFAEEAGLQFFAKRVLQSGIRRRGEVLARRRTERQVAAGVAGEELRLAPGPPDGELQRFA